MLLIKRTPGISVSRRRSGFSLIMVLIISMIGLAIIGATLQFTVMSSGSGRVVSAGNTKYNFLQDAVEEGKAALKQAMDSPDIKPPRYFPEDGASADIGVIVSVDQLLIKHDFDTGLQKGWVFTRLIDKGQLGKLGIAGNGATLDVKIYDMQYKGDDVDPAIPSDQMKLLPPAMSLFGGATSYHDPTVDDNPFSGSSGGGGSGSGSGGSGGGGGGAAGETTNAGVYLIRASLLINGQAAPTILDTAVIQSIKDEE